MIRLSLESQATLETSRCAAGTAASFSVFEYFVPLRHAVGVERLLDSFGERQICELLERRPLFDGVLLEAEYVADEVAAVAVVARLFAVLRLYAVDFLAEAAISSTVSQTAKNAEINLLLHLRSPFALFRFR